MAEFLPHKNLSVRETSHKTTCSLCKYLCLVLVIFFFLVPDAASQKWLGGFIHWWCDSRGQALFLLPEPQCSQQSLAKSWFDHVPGSSYGMLVIHALWFPPQLHVLFKSCLGTGLFTFFFLGVSLASQEGLGGRAICGENCGCEKRREMWLWNHGRILRAMFRSSQCEFTMGKSCLTSLIDFCIETSWSLHGRRAVGVICIEFSLQHVVLWHPCFVVWNAVA